MLFHRVHVWYTPIETLSFEDTQFYLGYVEPTAMFGGVVNLKPFGEPAGLFWRKRLIERCGGVSVQIVHDKTHLVGIRIAFIEHAFDPPRPVRSGPVLGHIDVSSAG